MQGFEGLYRDANRPPRQVCVFCGSRHIDDSEIAGSAAEFGRLLALEGIGLVYGGEEDDLTGSVAQASAENGGRVTAVVRHAAARQNNTRHFADEIVLVSGLQERKKTMFERADVLIALPGGVGAIEELSEVLTLQRDVLSHKLLLIANFGKFWNPLLDLFMYLRSSGFICGEGLDKCLVVEHPQAILSVLRKAQHPDISPAATRLEARAAAFA